MCVPRLSRPAQPWQEGGRIGNRFKRPPSQRPGGAHGAAAESAWRSASADLSFSLSAGMFVGLARQVSGPRRYHEPDQAGPGAWMASPAPSAGGESADSIVIGRYGR